VPINSHHGVLLAQNPITTKVRFKLPNRGTPGGTIGGATRSTSKTLTAIVPQKKIGLTINKSPLLFVYIPKNEANQGKLVISDEENKTLYERFLPVQKTEGILMIKVPEKLNLSEGKPYKWEFFLLNENGEQIGKEKTFGWVEKVSLNSNLEKINQPNLDRWETVNILAEEGIWQDTLEQLAFLHLADPDNTEIKQEWTELLKFVGLNNIANSEILPYVIEVQ